jgi:hypothetical protein
VISEAGFDGLGPWHKTMYEPHEVHRGKPGGDCTVVDWVNGESAEETVAAGVKLELARTPIDATWDGDHFEWEPITKEVAG